MARWYALPAEPLMACATQMMRHHSHDVPDVAPGQPGAEADVAEEWLDELVHACRPRDQRGDRGGIGRGEELEGNARVTIGRCALQDAVETLRDGGGRRAWDSHMRARASRTHRTVGQSSRIQAHRVGCWLRLTAVAAGRRSRPSTPGPPMQHVSPARAIAALPQRGSILGAVSMVPQYAMCCYT